MRGVQSVLPSRPVPRTAAAVSEGTVFCRGKLADSCICWFWPLGHPGLLGQFVLERGGRLDITQSSLFYLFSIKGKEVIPAPLVSVCIKPPAQRFP